MKAAPGGLLRASRGRFVPEDHVLSGHAAAIVAHGGVMAAGDIDVGMAQHVGHQVDIAGGLIQIGTKGGAQFVGTQAGLEGRGL